MAPHAQRAAGGAAANAVLFLLVWHLTAAPWRLCTANTQKIAELKTCFNRDCLKARTTWQHMVDNQPSCLSVVNVWWSQKPVKLPVTLITQLSADRLMQVEAQCATWAGPLAAALYVPLYNPSYTELTTANREKLENIREQVDDFFRKVEAKPNGCAIRLLLVYEVFSEEKAVVLYPVNTLRNYARLLADTDLITNIDVDMVPSLSISTTLSDPAALARYAAAASGPQRALYIWPALETKCGGPAFADNIAVTPKPRLKEHMKDGCLTQMRGKVAKWCHGPTRYEQWFATSEPYRVGYKELFEPWFLSARKGSEWFDVGYRGYGKNKIVQAAAMNATGYAFHVFPDGFVVHRPHTESKVRRQFLKAKFSKKALADLKGTVFEHVESLWKQHKEAMAAGTYRVSVEEQFRSCVRKLSWWGPSMAGSV